MKKMDKKKLAAIIGIVISLVIIGWGIYAIVNNRKQPEKSPIKEVKVKEEDVTNTFGTTKEEAIEAVKNIYNGDSYEFEATIRADNFYIVTVTHVVTKNKVIYEVNPQTLDYKEIDEVKNQDK